MGLDLWFRQDVARILASTWETMHSTAEGTRPGGVTASDDRLAGAYRRGFEDALRAVGLAFGLAEGGNGVRRIGEMPASGSQAEYARSWGED